MLLKRKGANDTTSETPTLSEMSRVATDGFFVVVGVCCRNLIREGGGDVCYKSLSDEKRGARLVERPRQNVAVSLDLAEICSELENE